MSCFMRVFQNLSTELHERMEFPVLRTSDRDRKLDLVDFWTTAVILSRPEEEEEEEEEFEEECGEWHKDSYIGLAVWEVGDRCGESAEILHQTISQEEPRFDAVYLSVSGVSRLISEGESWRSLMKVISAISIPDNVEEICDECFSKSQISRITFGESSALKRIGKGAFFRCCNLREVLIPNNVEDIGDRCFCRCYRLCRVTFGKSLVV